MRKTLIIKKISNQAVDFGRPVIHHYERSPERLPDAIVDKENQYDQSKEFSRFRGFPASIKSAEATLSDQITLLNALCALAARVETRLASLAVEEAPPAASEGQPTG